MLRWLRSLFRSCRANKQQAIAQPETRHEPDADVSVTADLDQPNAPTAPPQGGAVMPPDPVGGAPVAPEHSGGAEGAIEDLIRQLLPDSRTENRRAAAAALGRLGPAAMPALLALMLSLAQADRALRQAALSALNAIDPDWRQQPAIQQVMPSWARVLSGGDLEVNNDLYQQICLIGAPAAPGLAGWLTAAGDVTGSVFVLRALGRLGPEAAQAVPAIVRSLASQYSQVRIAAAEVLERIGPAAAAAVPALTASLQHWNSDVREVVARCLAQIGPAAGTASATPAQASNAGGSQVRPASRLDLGELLARLAQPARLSELPERVQWCEQALALVKRQDDPLTWARLQNELAKSLAQSPTGDPAGNIELAIQHYGQALEVLTRQAYPEDWAMIQNNLAAAYRRRVHGERADNIETAIACCESALEVRTRQADPEGWATAHNNLANAYRDRCQGDRAENVEQTLRHCQLALEAFTPQAHPWKWATAQNNLANAYLDRVRGSRAENHEQAIHHYQEALRVFTRSAYPEDWAWTHCNLGAAYRTRDRGGRTENLERAIQHLQQALEVYTRESIPEEWAVTHTNLGNAYQERLHGEPGDNLTQAVWHYRQAAEVFTRAAHPERWAALQSQLASVAERRLCATDPQQASAASQSAQLTHPQFYQEESRLQPGEKRELTLIFADVLDFRTLVSLGLVYEWAEELPGPEAERLAQRAIAYISCAIYDAATAAGLSCWASPIPNGRRPAWLIAQEPAPISLTLSDIDMADRTCQMSIGPVVFAVRQQAAAHTSVLAQLAAGFKARFSTICV